MIDSPNILVVSASPLVHGAWRDALDGATVLGPDDDSAGLDDAEVLVLDVPSMSQLRAVLRGGARDLAPQCIWVHADIEPEDVVTVRAWGVTHTMHRSAGLAPLLALVREDRDHPRASLIGRIRDDAALDELSAEETLLLRRLGAGQTVAQLRAATGWSRHEVERLRVSALGKLGVHTTGEALAILMLADLSSA